MKPLMRSSLDCFLGRICINLDDFDGIVDLLRQHCRSVQIVAHDMLIKESSQFQGLLAEADRPVRDLEIEAHDPFLRIRFGGLIRGSGDRRWRTKSEIVSDADDSVAASLRAKIEVILKEACGRGPIPMLAGFTGNEKRSGLISGLIVGSIFALVMFGPLLIPAARSLLIDLETATLLMAAPLAVILAVMLPFCPCQPVLLLERGRVTGR
ncbi:MAG TPA: hypothetical protein VKA15_07420, partial [Isosphaeraceae bacterium]|nr:hypothetical protein [Isosphaeraceae bacterium]